ncbi:MAG: hypothetical protein U0790_03915 [Isosphaeraceae bacterium]
MYFEASCPCGQSFRVASTNRGRRVRCPACGESVPTGGPSRLAGTLSGPVSRETGDQGDRAASGAPRRARRRGALAAWILTGAAALAGVGYAQRATLMPWWERVRDETRRTQEARYRYQVLAGQGRTALADRRYDAAETAFRAARDLCSAGDERRSEAERLLAGVDRARREDFDAAMNVGREALRSHHHDEATAAFERARALFESQIRSDELARAEAALKDAAARRAREPEYRASVAAGDQAASRGNFAAALEAYAKAEEASPDDPVAAEKKVRTGQDRDRFVTTHAERGRAALRSNDPEKAVDVLEKAVAAGGDVSRARESLGQARDALATDLIGRARRALATDSPSQAIAHLDRARAVAPGRPELAELAAEAGYRDGLARCRKALELRDYRLAEVQARRAVESRPGDAQAERLRREVQIALERGEAGRFQGHSGPVSALAFDADADRLVAAFADGRLQSWDLTAEPGSLPSLDLQPPTGPKVATVALSADGSTFARAVGGGRVEVIKCPRGTIAQPSARELATSLPAVSCLALGADGSSLAAGGGGDIRLWSLAPGPPAERPLTPASSSPRKVTCLAFSRDGRTLAVGRESGNIELHDAPAGGRRRSLEERAWEQASPVTALAFAPDRVTLVSARSNGVVSSWFATTGRRGEQVRPHRSAVTSAAFSPDGKCCVTAAEDGGTYWVSHTDGGAAHRRVRTDVVLHVGPVLAMAFDASTSRLATAGHDGLVKLWTISAATSGTAEPAPRPQSGAVRLPGTGRLRMAR